MDNINLEKPKGQKKFNFKVPHTYVILLAVVIIVTIMTYVVPAGVYERIKDPNTGRTLVNPTSYHIVERTPVNLFSMVKAVPDGMAATANIIFFIFICGGAFSMIQATGAIDSGVSRAVSALKGKEKLLIPVTMFLFSIMGFTYGAAEEVIVFVPIGIQLARAVGYDDIVGVAMMSTGAAIGFCGGMLNPFTVGVAQGIAELPLFSGMWYRIIGYVVLYIIAVAYVMRYANKVKADPKASLVYDLVEHNEGNEGVSEISVFEPRHKLVLLVVVLGLGYMIYGVMKKGWYISELSTVFLAMGIAAGLAGKIGPSKLARSFVAGAKDIAFGALVVGIARAILIVMTQGQIIDTVISGLASTISSLPGSLNAAGMFWVHSIINFFIPSGSGQAATTMPIMTPLADLVGITRQSAVLAFQYGDGFSNQIIPTSAALMGVLGMGKIPYERWFKYNWRLMVYWTAAGTVLVFISALIN